MNFDRIVRTDIATDGNGVLATMRLDEAALREMAGKLDAELFDRIAAERGYRRQGVDVAALAEIAAELDDMPADGGGMQSLEYGSVSGRIREAIDGEVIPKQVSDVPHCPRCLHDGYWRRVGSSDAEGFEELRCAGCGRDYRYKRPEKGGER